MKEQLLDAWRIHHKMNELLIDNTTDNGWQKTLSARGGRTICLQWVHVHNVRMQWLEICDPEIFKQSKSLDKNTSPGRALLKEALHDSFRGVETLLGNAWDNGGKVRGFKKGVIPLLGYFISHESHHRGNIILTLKQNGEKIPDPIKWGLWEWGK